MMEDKEPHPIKFCVVIVVKKFRGDTEIVEWLKWDNMSMELRNKYDWYFQYRAALLIVKHPRYFHEFKGSHTYETMTAEQRADRDKFFKTRSKKAKITEWKSKIALAEKNWNELFPITEYDPYIKAKEKLLRLEHELLELKP